MIVLSVPGYPNQPCDSALFIFMSFNMPKESLKLWAEQASRVQCPLLLQGFVDNDLIKTTEKTRTIFGEKADVEILIDPEKFEKFKIDMVPAVMVVEPYNAQSNKADSHDNTTPSFDVVYGDTSLEEALKRIAKSGSEVNQKAANHYLKQYRGKP